MSLYRVINIVFVVCFLFLNIVSGQDLNINMMDSIYTRLDVNPAYRFNKKIQIQLPGLYVGYYTNGASVGDVLIDNGGINEVKLREGLDYINEDNYLNGESTVNFIGIGIDFGTIQLSGGYDWKIIGSISYTNDLAKLIANGNAPYVGEELDVSTDFVYQSYHELYLGASYKINNFVIGARAKLLSGIEDLSTDRSQIQLTTDDEIYQLNVQTDFSMNTSGVLDYNGIEDIDLTTEIFDFNNFFGSNLGVAFDLGIDWAITNKLNFSASILDLGSINWDNQTRNYSGKNSNSYEGIDILDYIDEDNDIVIEDSLYNLFQLNETNENYSTSLGTKYNISATYKVNEKLTIGANYHNISNLATSRDMLLINGQFKMLPWISMGLGAGRADNSPILVPLNMIIYAGPFTGFISTDNLLTGLSLTNSRVGNIRLGVTLGL